MHHRGRGIWTRGKTGTWRRSTAAPDGALEGALGRSFKGTLGPCRFMCPHAHIWEPFCQCKVSPSAYMGAFLRVQRVPMPIYGGLFASAKCPHPRIWGPFCQCKVSPSAYMGAFLPVQSVPIRVYGGPFCQCKVSPSAYMGAFLRLQSVHSSWPTGPIPTSLAGVRAVGSWVLGFNAWSHFP